MLNFKEISILSGEQTQNRKLCKICGHSLLIPTKKEKKICSHCGNYVFKDDIAEFNFRVRQNRIKQKRKQNLTN